MTELVYEVYDPAGRCVLGAPECCRYSRRVELQLLEAGYSIRLRGRRITKNEVKRRNG